MRIFTHIDIFAFTGICISALKYVNLRREKNVLYKKCKYHVIIIIKTCRQHGYP